MPAAPLTPPALPEPHSPGERLFARYAHGPNALGYCGPPVRASEPGLVDVAIGQGQGVDVRALARRFSGAWPYQSVIASLAHDPDPLSESVGRAYWTGNDVTAGLDREAFGSALLETITPTAGHYWSHLGPDLLAEAAPTHTFHVLGVYPWSRLLATGLPEPLTVIDSCRIRAGKVLAVEGEHLIVEAASLRFDESGLQLLPDATERVAWLADGHPFAAGVEPGAYVALHWGFACDVLTQEDVDHLEYWTRWQLKASNPRMRALSR